MAWLTHLLNLQNAKFAVTVSVNELPGKNSAADSKVSRLAEFTLNNVCFYLTFRDLGNEKSLSFVLGTHFFGVCALNRNVTERTPVCLPGSETTALTTSSLLLGTVPVKRFFAVVCKSKGLICCFLEVDTVLINDVWLLHWSLG